MRNEMESALRILAICLVAALSSGELSFAQQAKVKPVGRVVIVDSKGKTVGSILGGVGFNIKVIGGVPPNLGIRFVVLLEVDEQVVPVAVFRDRFSGGGGLFFESENCLGTPWLITNTSPNEPPNLLPQVAIGPPGQTLYVETPGASPQSVTTKSLLVGFSTCSNQTFQLSLLPAQALVNLETVFTPPFSLRAAP